MLMYFINVNSEYYINIDIVDIHINMNTKGSTNDEIRKNCTKNFIIQFLEIYYI